MNKWFRTTKEQNEQLLKTCKRKKLTHTAAYSLMLEWFINKCKWGEK